MWEELAGQVVHHDQLIICKPRLSENALLFGSAEFPLQFQLSEIALVCSVASLAVAVSRNKLHCSMYLLLTATAARAAVRLSPAGNQTEMPSTNVTPVFV